MCRSAGSQFVQGDEVEHVPDRVLGERLVKGKLQYQVRWKVIGDRSWEQEHNSPGGLWPRRGVSRWSEMPVVRRWHRLLSEERARRVALVLCNVVHGEEDDEQGEDGEHGEESDDEDDEWKATTAEERTAVRKAIDTEEEEKMAREAKAVEATEAAALVQDEISALPFAIHFALKAAGEVCSPCTLRARGRGLDVWHVGARRCSFMNVGLLMLNARPACRLCRRTCLRSPESPPDSPSSRLSRLRAASRRFGVPAATISIPRGDS